MANSINATSTGNGGITTTGDDSGVLNIQTNETTAVTVDSSQNVGIGTSSPQQRLDVTGGYLQLRDSTGSGGYRLTIGADSTSCRLNSVDNTPLTFSMGGSEKARIDSSGNLLVGVTAWADGGGGSFISNHASSGINGKFSCSSTSNQVIFYFTNPNGVVGLIQASGSTTSYVTSSDYRLKENVQPMQGALEKVSQLKPCTYTWKADGSNGQGFIAHELAEVCPDAVAGEKDDVNEDGSIKPQGIDTSFLVATLTAAIQEQQALITTLTERITALEAK